MGCGRGTGEVMRQEEVDNKGAVSLTCFTFLQLPPGALIPCMPSMGPGSGLSSGLSSATTCVSFIFSGYPFPQLKSECYKSMSPFHLHLSCMFKYCKTHAYPSGI